MDKAPTTLVKKGGWSSVEEPGKGKAVTHDLDYNDSTDLHETRETSFRRYETSGYLDHGSFAQASLDTPLPDDNRGMKLLYKMGWKKDTSLGKDGTGIVKPIQLVDASLGYGLGKQEEYDQNAGEATRNRKLLDIEVEETEELKKKRMEKDAKEQALKQEIKDMNKEFYCELCDKQYKTVGEMSNHYSSYDHHHTKRLKEAKEAERARKASKAGSRAKQDQALVDRELQRRMQAAAAIRQPSAPAPPSAPQPPPPPHPLPFAPPPPPPGAFPSHYGGMPFLPPPPPHTYPGPPIPPPPHGYPGIHPPPPPPPVAPPLPPPPAEAPPPPPTAAPVPENRAKISFGLGVKAKVQKKPGGFR